MTMMEAMATSDSCYGIMPREQRASL